MKKYFMVLFSFSLAAFFFAGCYGPPEVGWDPRAWDSRVFHLPYDCSIAIAGAEGGSLNMGYRARVVYPIAEFCYNDRFVGMKNTSAMNEQNELIPLEAWYILDALDKTVYGPYASVQEYEAALDDLGVTALSDWIATVEKK